jgi:acetamidase/formamidase
MLISTMRRVRLCTNTLTGISRDEAYALSSFDLHVTQTVNNVKGVHAMIDRSILRLA